MLICERNATGKTNLGRALVAISSNMSGVGFLQSQKETYLNADSSERVASFVYVFQLPNHYDYTQYEFNDE